MCGLVLKEFERFLPVEGFFLLAAVVEEMHSQADVDAHGFEGLLTRLPVDDIVAEVVAVLQRLECRLWEQF